MSLQAVNFVHPPRPPRAGWVWLGLGIALLTGAAWLNERWADERTELERAQQAQAEALHARQLQSAKPIEPSASDRRLRKVQAELDRPWLRALGVVEAATKDPVYLLSVVFAKGSDGIRLDAEAPSFEEALAYAQRLQEGRRVISSASLVSHEQVVDASSGRNLVRFTVMAQWSER